MKRWLVLALLLPLLAAAEEPQFGSLEDLEKVLLPGTYRCMPWSDQQVESSFAAVPGSVGSIHKTESQEGNDPVEPPFLSHGYSVRTCSPE